MALDSVRARRTRTSSDLRALSAALLPPSPVLGAGDVLTCSTSGEIPILLEATTRAAKFGKPPGVWNLGGEVTDKDDATCTVNTEDSITGDGVTPDSWMGGSAELPDGLHAESFLAWGVSCGLNNVHAVRCDSLGSYSGRLCPQDGCSPHTWEKHGALLDPRASCPHAAAFGSTPIIPREDPEDDPNPTITTSTYSTLPTPTFAPPSPSTDVISPSSSPTSRQRHRRPLERARAVRFPGRPKSPRLQVNEIEAHAHPPVQHAYPRRQLVGTASMGSTSPCTNTLLPFMKHVALPGELSWLEHLVIELWFDQEGFRAARSCMQLVGYSPRTRSLYPYEPAENIGSDITAGVAEFMPTKRETFAYHYATLDGPPTLRMISVAGDESRDYISRQATLSVKFNGVYTVLGTETPVASILMRDEHESHIHNVGLRWKLDYLVSDRKTDGTGKALPGEKILTPLTFSCSPYLFHPLQGKKAGLMHIMKKNLAPKLGSHKVEPPPYTPNRSSTPLQTNRYLSSGRDIIAHARSHSDALAKGSHYPLTRSPALDNQVTSETISDDHVQHTRRRRASSAGENSLTWLRNEARCS